MTFRGDVAYALPTFNKWQKKNNKYKNKKVTLHMLARGIM